MRPEPAALLAIDHEELVIRRGQRSGFYCAIAVHSTTLGPALGGCRMWHYPNPAEALRDALRLSRAMTLKAAAAGLSVGGGKGVICLPPDTPAPAPRAGGLRRDALLDFADAINALAGSYITAEDVGTSARDMVVVAQGTSYVTGLPAVHGGSGDPSPFTALGVEAAIRACSTERFG
jgi:leucine dehydrogenase